MYCMLALFQASATLGFDRLQYANVEGDGWGDGHVHDVNVSVSVYLGRQGEGSNPDKGSQSPLL